MSMSLFLQSHSVNLRVEAALEEDVPGTEVMEDLDEAHATRL